MKHPVIAMLGLAGALLGSCNVHEVPGTGTPGEIRFRVEASDFVKADALPFGPGDVLGLFAGDPVGKVNLKARVEGTALIPEETLFWGPGQTGATRFVAYSPYDGSYSGPSGSFVVKERQDREGIASSDLMAATASSAPTTEPVPLLFKHLLTKVLVQVDNRTAKPVSSVVLSGLSRTAAASLEGQSVQGEAVGGERIYAEALQEGSLYQLIAVPHEALEPGRGQALDLTIGTGTVSQTIDQAFPAGKVVVVEVVIEETLATFSVSIVDWEKAHDLIFTEVE